MKKPDIGKDMYRKDEWIPSQPDKIGVFYTTSHSRIGLHFPKSSNLQCGFRLAANPSSSSASQDPRS
ncbi:hypothetical protein PGT21_029246 [Puccinia graminis f. sp. tritici]|uniref:Uncharacterized protein n=1 Tax=Puccinia graminis f. sp. tritici TaxID=56615 RepID=A0A5B0NZQ9_PUCGR|nr:hypothetical protein PGT21_029246 [Puccinia graminis f. sp. tritici]KAA1121551.1 hypothetical protein PGTUg99_031969 [Puccinia graminis f. sp. tritici]